MAISDWRSFYDSLTILSGFGKPAPLPTVEQLDRFESTVGFQLPHSYRDYILVFGPGEFPCLLKIAAPGYEQLGSTYDLEEAHARYGFSPALIATSHVPPAQKERLLRLYYFGLERGRSWLGWDLAEPHQEGGLEYNIYRVDGLDDEPEFVASTFRSMVEAVCERLFFPDPDYNEEEMGPLRAFQPAIITQS